MQVQGKCQIHVTETTKTSLETGKYTTASMVTCVLNTGLLISVIEGEKSSLSGLISLSEPNYNTRRGCPAWGTASPGSSPWPSEIKPVTAGLVLLNVADAWQHYEGSLRTCPSPNTRLSRSFVSKQEKDLYVRKISANFKL